MISNKDIVIDESKSDLYVRALRDFCLVNGLVLFPKQNTSGLKTHNSAMHLPVTLTPIKFSRANFNYALSVQKHFNELVHKISNDHQFLSESLKNIIQADEFTKRLWQIYETVRSEGIAQPISLDIIRSDYMLDSTKLTQAIDEDNNEICLSQIEINTIASSFGSSTTKVAKLHSYMLKQTGKESFISLQPENNNVQVLAKGLIDAWKLYNNEKAEIAFIVNEVERNIGDQRLLEYEMFNLEPRLKVNRVQLSQICQNAKLTDQKCLFINDSEIALVYYRDGYDPDHYNSEKDWEARLMIERSKAIKCPSIQHHLTGTKKIQQALCVPGVLEKFLGKDAAAMVRATFVDQHSFNFNGANSSEGEENKLLELINEKCEDYVLKPQREGGGNNIYGKDIRDFVKSLPSISELNSYILMKLIKPILRENYMIKNDSEAFVKEPVISEIGIYGVVIGDTSDKILVNETGGYLLRSKSLSTNEGGVAAGFSSLDSVYLV